VWAALAFAAVSGGESGELKIVADESVDKQIVERLRVDGHDTMYVVELDPGIDGSCNGANGSSRNTLDKWFLIENAQPLPHGRGSVI
jgi:hypothetical protein